MHRIARLVLTLGLLAAAPRPGGAQPEARDLSAVADHTRHAVVFLRILDAFGVELGSGSGFFVDPEGVIVTNYHVIEPGSRVEAVLSNKRTLEVVGVLATDKANDLAVIKVDDGPFPALELADSSAVVPGQRVVVLGNPLGLAGSLSEGIVSALRAGDELPGEHHMPLLQITAAISPGSSGSPVMNLAGEVVGVAVLQANMGQNLNFAVPSTAVRELLGTIDAGVPPRPLGSVAGAGVWTYARNLALSLLVFGAIWLGFRYLR
ncbi:MAG TPA: trypsin-like peptidase domain-containing protein [Thermoanaerobaculia bacterium]|jgi:S1-C subfamily serine protease